MEQSPENKQTARGRTAPRLPIRDGDIPLKKSGFAGRGGFQNGILLTSTY
jgi:hypothetical protein